MPPTSDIHGTRNRNRLEWLPIAAGLLLLFVPTFYNAATTFWQSEENAHGPIIFLIVLWLIWSKRPALLANNASAAVFPGIAVLVFGLLVYVVGHSQGIALLEIGALVPTLAGVILAMRGWRALRTLWFPILFIVFMLPLPGFVVDALTAPLKQSVSQIAEQILYVLGYPIARNGVMLTVGPYQLLVADACSGLHSLFSLSALGLLFMYLMSRPSRVHNVIMAASILPIAFTANIVRVITLILVTYHLGDEAGQGFLHNAAGIVLLLAALAALLALDALLARAIRQRAVA